MRIRRTFISLICLIVLSSGTIFIWAESLRSYERSKQLGAKYATSGSVLRSDEINRREDKRFTGEEWRGLTRLIDHGEPYLGMMAKIGLVRGICEGARTIDL